MKYPIAGVAQGLQVTVYFCLPWLLCLSLSVGNLDAQALDAQPAEVSTSQELGVAYLDSVYSFRFEETKRLLSADAEFRDESATALQGSVVGARGAEAIVELFRAGAAALRRADYTIERSFSNGSQLVLVIDYEAEIDRASMGMGQGYASIRVAAVTVLVIEDGRIASHTDFVDYASLLRQVQRD
ncbi:MAG: nuclear transport factor 2 family protein [Pseudomonadota bacterium]